jgi:cytochrome d ubiquinol oxidase subunit II
MVIAWSALLLLCLLLYVVLDGYDLGVGIAMLLERDERRRRAMLEQVAVGWDGNETWLVLLAVGLWAGFPLAFGTILPHAYLAVIVMLFSLIIRGASVEMASQAKRAPRWELAFSVASLTAALAQGVVLATLASNLTLRNGAFVGSPVKAMGAYSALVALTVASVYLALGYAYLKGKTSREMQAIVGWRGVASAAVAAAMLAWSLVALNGTAAPLNLHTPGRAIGSAGLLLFAAAGVVVAVVTSRPSRRSDALPYAGLVTAVVAVLGAVVVARAPVIAPPSLTLADSVSPNTTMVFIAVGIGLNVPLILFYTWFAHHAFRDRAQPLGTVDDN